MVSPSYQILAGVDIIYCWERDVSYYRRAGSRMLKDYSYTLFSETYNKNNYRKEQKRQNRKVKNKQERYIIFISYLE